MMAVSTGTFAERIMRIETGTTVQAASLPHKPTPKIYKQDTRRPLVMWLCILCILGCIGGVAYAWYDGIVDYNMFLALIL
jgi:hypothetical protein